MITQHSILNISSGRSFSIRVLLNITGKSYFLRPKPAFPSSGILSVIKVLKLRSPVLKKCSPVGSWLYLTIRQWGVGRHLDSFRWLIKDLINEVFILDRYLSSEPSIHFFLRDISLGNGSYKKVCGFLPLYTLCGKVQNCTEGLQVMYLVTNNRFMTMQKL
jgi:hypothetical protein